MNFEFSDLDDVPPLYNLVLQQISSQDFYENKESESDLRDDRYQQKVIDQKVNISNNQNKDPDKCKRELLTNSKAFSYHFHSLLTEPTVCFNLISEGLINIYDELKPDKLLIPETFFIISDIYYNQYRRTRKEIILRLYSIPYNESNYIVHLKDKWCSLNVKVNDPILVIGSFKRTFINDFHKIQNTFLKQVLDNTFNFCYEETIDNKHGFIILWPYFMISATRISGSYHCRRQSVLTSMVPYTTVQSNWILNEGTIAHSLVEDVLTRRVESVDQIQNNVNNLIDQNIILNGPQGISRNEMNSRLEPIANLADQLSTNIKNQETIAKLEINIKTLQQQQQDNQNQIEQNLELQKTLNENELLKQIEIQDKIEQQRIENEKIQKIIQEKENEMKKLEIFKKESLDSPPYGCDVFDNEENIVSLDFSFLGKIDVTLYDNKKRKFFPLEMKSGKSANKKAKNHHQIQLSTYVLMMRDLRKNKAEDYGMLFYMNDMISVKIKPSFSEFQSLALLRNFITEDSMQGNIPPKKDDHLYCEFCQALDVCNFMTDIEDIEVGNYKPKAKPKQSTKCKNKKQSLSNHDYDEIMDIIDEEEYLEIAEYGFISKKKKEKNVIVIDEFDDYEYDDYNETESPKLQTYLESPNYTLEQINFYKKIQKEIRNDIHEKGFQQYFNWSLPVDEREKRGIAVNGLQLLPQNNTLFFISEKFKNSKFKAFSKFVITENGKPPILNTGMIKAIHPDDKSIVFVSFDTKDRLFEDKSNLCIDLIHYITDNTYEIHNLFKLFAYSHSKLQTVTSIFIENEKSRIIENSDIFFSACEVLLYGLNEDQKKAVKNTIISKDYSIISGCKNSGKTLVLANLIQYFESQNKSILVICPSDSSSASLINILVDISSFAFMQDHEVALVRVKSILEATIFITNVDDYQNSVFIEKNFDILIVDDCERIKMQKLIGPILTAQKFIFCGDVFQSRKDFLSLFSFLNIEKNGFNFLRTKYLKSQEIHKIENSMIYNKSTYLHSDICTELKINLSKLNDFHPIHKTWLHPVLSSPTFFIDVDDSNIQFQSSITAALAISLLTCDVKSNSIGILCYDEICPSLINKAFNSFSEETFSIDIYDCSNFLDEMKSYKVLVVCFGECDASLTMDEVQSTIIKADEKLYLIGNKKKLKANPFFDNLTKKMNGSEKINQEVFKAEAPFTGMFDLIA